MPAVVAMKVDAQGRSWRSGAVVEQKKLRQWFLKVTDFGDALVDGLDTLKDWPDKVKTLQRAWIGRSTGAVLKFKLDGATAGGHVSDLEVFTTKPDSLPGVSFVAIAADHPLVDVALKAATTEARKTELSSFAARCLARSALEAETDEVLEAHDTGLCVVHPIYGDKVLIMPRRDFCVRDLS